ncbi:MAG TPA: hypothetical protein VLB49_10700 [Gemmatimonadales bacterium]|nr:hypothetical protein [Gemmatimonadales bacterium]
MSGYPWTPAFIVLAAAYVVASSVGANPKNAGVAEACVDTDSGRQPDESLTDGRGASQP